MAYEAVEDSRPYMFVPPKRMTRAVRDVGESKAGGRRRVGSESSLNRAIGELCRVFQMR